MKRALLAIVVLMAGCAPKGGGPIVTRTAAASPSIGGASARSSSLAPSCADIGDLSQTRTYSASGLSVTDDPSANPCYRFTLSEHSQVAGLASNHGYLAVSRDLDDGVVHDSFFDGNGESIDLPMPPGAYTLSASHNHIGEVFDIRIAATPYEGCTPTSPPPGHPAQEAPDLLGFEQARGYVGHLNEADFFRVSVDDRSRLTLVFGAVEPRDARSVFATVYSDNGDGIAAQSERVDGLEGNVHSQRQPLELELDPGTYAVGVTGGPAIYTLRASLEVL